MSVKTSFIAVITLFVSNAALADSTFTGTGLAVHDSRNAACQEAEEKARLDATRQAKSFVQKTVTATLSENEHGLQQSRTEYIENTIYSTAQLLGDPTEQVRVVDNTHVECVVKANYRIDSDAVRQHYKAEQARVSNHTERQNLLASLHQELTQNQQAYLTLQQQLPPEIRKSESLTTNCETSLRMTECEEVIREAILQPHIDNYSSKLKVPAHIIQGEVTLDGQIQIQAANNRQKKVQWQGDYVIRLQLNDPYTSRNTQLQSQIHNLQHPPQSAAARSESNGDKSNNKNTDDNKRVRLATSFGTDCLFCSATTLSQSRSLNKDNRASIKGNNATVSINYRRWLSVNAGVYAENFVLCTEKGRGENCQNAVTDNALLPALGLTLRYNTFYIEAMHLFAIKEFSAGDTAIKQSYQRVELGLSSDPQRAGFSFALGVSTRILPKQDDFAWGDNWDFNLKLGYVF